MRDTITTLAVATGGMASQFTNLDLVIKLCIGFVTLWFVFTRTIVFIVRNWHILRNPREAIRKRRAEKEETTTV